MRRVFLAVVSIAVLFALGTRPRAIPAPSCEVDDVERIVAVGDVHGAYDRYLEILKVAAIVDEKGKWAGGKSHFVQLGDIVDRGPDSRKVLDFLQKLTKDASSAGGRVHVLIGNHEAMRLLGDLRYVHAGETAAFATPESVDLRKQAVESAPPDQRERLLKETPLGLIELMRAFSPDGSYGSYIQKMDAVVRINGVLFLHGGVSPAVAPMSCTEINETVRKELGKDLDKTRKAPLLSLTARADGPLWYRGLAQEPDTFAPQVDAILLAQHAKTMVIAHSVQDDGRISQRFGGKVILMDTGMQQGYVPIGRASALEIRGDAFTAIYTDKRDSIR